MAINFPTSLDVLTNPAAGDPQNAPSHSSQHANANNILEALEAKVGIDGSAVTTSHDYKLSGVTGSAKAVSDAVVTGGANPTGTIGLAAVNGSALTFMRSDGAPVIDLTAAFAFSNLSTTTIAKPAGTGTQTPSLTITGPAHTTLTASTESIGANFNFSATKQFATGALTTQREVVIQAPTYSAVAASTITTATTLDVTAPIAGTNVTITDAPVAMFRSGALATAFITLKSVTSNYGAFVKYTTATGTWIAGASLGAGGNFTIYDETNSKYLLSIDSNGMLGLGTFAPSNRLEICGRNTADNNIRLTYDGTNYPFSINTHAHGTVPASAYMQFKISAADGTGPGNTAQSTPLTLYGDGSSVFTPGAAAIGVVVKGAASRTVALINLQTSAAGSLGNVSGGCVKDIIATVSTTSTDGTFDTLDTTTFVANSLIANGDKHCFDYTLTFVGHATASRRVKLAFAGITIFDSGALTPGTGTTTVRVFGYVSRVSSTTAMATVSFLASGGATLTFATANIQAFVAPGTLTGLTLTGTNALVLSAAAAGAGASSADISLLHGRLSVEGFGS